MLRVLPAKYHAIRLNTFLKKKGLIAVYLPKEKSFTYRRPQNIDPSAELKFPPLRNTFLKAYLFVANPKYNSCTHRVPMSQSRHLSSPNVTFPFSYKTLCKSFLTAWVSFAESSYCYPLSSRQVTNT